MTSGLLIQTGHQVVLLKRIGARERSHGVYCWASLRCQGLCKTFKWQCQISLQPGGEVVLEMEIGTDLAYWW
jgi:hypothetical protein